MAGCPHTCPGQPPLPQKEYKEAGSSLGPTYGPYVPGSVSPWVPKQYPAGHPPLYLPQPSETTSGDILTMQPVGPWAAGHLDWSPQAGITGVRPVVDKYSITRWATNEWRENNAKMLSPRTMTDILGIMSRNRHDLDKAKTDIAATRDNSNRKLKERLDEENECKKKVEEALHRMTDEIEALMNDIAKLKGACRILMIPEAISKECLELRTHRYEPDQVRDDAEMELIMEVAIVGEIRKIFQDTLIKAETQLQQDISAKNAMEYVWSNKMAASKEDERNLSLTPQSNVLLRHPGVARWPDNASTYEFWKHHCIESIKNCDEVRESSQDLRSDLMTSITRGGQDLKTQSDRTNAALVDSVSANKELGKKLEETLKETLGEIVTIENFIDELKAELRRLDESDKLVMSRLYSRNYSRPGVENCRDDAQYALMGEEKFIRATVDSFKTKLRDSENARATLMKRRGDLEKDIASKRKSLNIDDDRFRRIRAFLPSPEEFAAV